VSQGSVLGPTLFLLYINDLADSLDHLQFTCKLYADDVKLYSSYEVGNYSADLNVALHRLIKWANS